MGTEWADTAPSQYDFSNYDMMLYFTLTEEKIIEMSRVRIELNYPRDIEKFNDYYHSHLSDYPTLKVSISTADFDRIAGPVRNLRNLSQIVLIIVTLEIVSYRITGASFHKEQIQRNGTVPGFRRKEVQNCVGAGYGIYDHRFSCVNHFDVYWKQNC